MMGPRARSDASLQANHVAAALLLMAAAFILAKTARDALFLQRGGVRDLPAAYMTIAVLSVPQAMLVLASLRRFGARRVRVVLPAAVSLLLVLSYAIVRPGGGLAMTAFFVAIPLLFSVMFSVAWLLAADFLEGESPETLSRAYGRIGAATIIGGIVGGVLARAVATNLPTRALLLIAAAGLACSAAIMARAQRRFQQGVRDAEEPPIPSVRVVLSQRHTLLLLAVAMSAALVGLMVEFQLYLAAASSGNDGPAGAVFFSTVYAFLNGIALVAQLWLLPWLHRMIGVHGSLMIMPGILLGGAAALLGSVSLGARSLLRVAEGSLKASVHRVSWEQAYLAIGKSQRAVAKVVVDGAGVRIAEGLAALMLFVWFRFVIGDGGLVGRDTTWLNYVLVVTALLWLGLTTALTRSLRPHLAAASRVEQRPGPPPDC